MEDINTSWLSQFYIGTNLNNYVIHIVIFTVYYYSLCLWGLSILNKVKSFYEKLNFINY